MNSAETLCAVSTVIVKPLAGHFESMQTTARRQ
jgi:hypothetical protein